MNILKKKINILLVEDEYILAMLHQEELEKKGYSVHHAASGIDAINAIAGNCHSYDLILMDIDLGDGIDGTQAAEQILKTCDIPVLFLSSHTEPKIVEKTESITSYGYVIKNSGIFVLDASIKMALKLFNSRLREKEKELELQKSEERYRKIFESAPIAIIFTRGTEVLFANESFLSMHGYSSLAEFQSVDSLNVFTPEYRPIIIENIKKRAQGLPVPNSYPAKCQRKDGTVFSVLLNFTVANLSDGPATIGFIFDLSNLQSKFLNTQQQERTI